MRGLPLFLAKMLKNLPIILRNSNIGRVTESTPLLSTSFKKIETKILSFSPFNLYTVLMNKSFKDKGQIANPLSSLTRRIT